MAYFEYRGRTAQGDLVTGIVESDSADAVANQLFNSGVTPIDIQPSGAPASRDISLGKLLGGGWPKTEDLVLFTRQMYSLTKSGVPLVRGLVGLAESIRNERLKTAIRDIVENIEQGRELSASLARHPRIFNPLYVSIVRVGEESGRLDEGFLRMFRYLELERETTKQIKQAVRYPLFVLIAISLAIVVLTIFVIPTFAQIFTRFDLELPLMTRIIIAVSNFMSANWPLLLVALIAGIGGFTYWKRTEKGRYSWDKRKLRFPIVGRILLQATLARFARAFSMAYRSGVPLIQTMTLCGRAVDNEFLAARIGEMRNGIEKGESVTRTANTTGLFTPLVLQMMQVGEETGQLDDMLEETAEFYEREVAYDVRNLSTLIEPLLTILLGAMVLVLALGVFLPMWDLVQIARR